MIRSTFISFGLHSFLLTLAYFGLPVLKTKEPIELPIDIVEETPISSKTSLKFGDTKEIKLKYKKLYSYRYSTRGQRPVGLSADSHGGSRSVTSSHRRVE